MHATLSDDTASLSERVDTSCIPVEPVSVKIDRESSLFGLRRPCPFHLACPPPLGPVERPICFLAVIPVDLLQFRRLGAYSTVLTCRYQNPALSAISTWPAWAEFVVKRGRPSTLLDRGGVASIAIRILLGVLFCLGTGVVRSTGVQRSRPAGVGGNPACLADTREPWRGAV